MEQRSKLFNLKTTLISFILIAFSFTSIAQEAPKRKTDFWQNVQFGGGLGLSFGNGFFAGSISPVGVYRFNEFVATGVGLNFGYTSERDFYESYLVGASALGLFNPIRELQISTEFQQTYINRSFDDRTLISDEKYWVPALFLGIGYSSNNITVGIQYDLLYDRNRSIYNDAWFPFVRVLF